jgi:hypothetical protein
MSDRAMLLPTEKMVIVAVSNVINAAYVVVNSLNLLFRKAIHLKLSNYA